MTLILDAGPLVALADEGDPRQRSTEDLLEAEAGSLVVPAAVTAEVDYLLTRRLGDKAGRAFVADLAAGRFVVYCPDADDYRDIAALERRYEQLMPGLADLSVVAAARYYGTRRVVTFDRRHFSVLRPLQGGSFELLPDLR